MGSLHSTECLRAFAPNARDFLIILVAGVVGGFSADTDLTWQAFASLGYQFNPRWSVQAGWRYFSAEKRIEGRDVKTDFSGPLLGFTARF